MSTSIEHTIDWIGDLEPRTFYEVDFVLDELRQLGLTVQQHQDEHSSYVEIGTAARTAKVLLYAWGDQLQAMVRRGLPFFVVDKQHVGKEVQQEHYCIVGYSPEVIRQLNVMGVGFLIKDENAATTLTCVGGDVIRALARVIAGTSPGDEYRGIGFAAQANVDAIKSALHHAG